MILNYFLEQLRETSISRHDELILYVADLLAKNIHTKENLITYKEPLCIQINKIDTSSTSSTYKRIQYQHVGNSALLYSALCRPAIKESGISLEYIQGFSSTAFMKAYNHGAHRINRLLSYMIEDVSNSIALKIKL